MALLKIQAMKMYVTIVATLKPLKVTYDADTLSLDHLIQYFLRAIGSIQC